jgi:hypothetical protein
MGFLRALSAQAGSQPVGRRVRWQPESWSNAPALQTLMIDAVQYSRSPIFFFQAQNDYNLAPSRVLSKAMRDVGKISVVKIYPAYGSSTGEGHSFAYRGGSVWGDDVFVLHSHNVPPNYSPYL